MSRLSIFIDTQIMIWGIEKRSRAEQKDQIVKAVSYIELSLKNKDRLLTCSIAAAEFLGGIGDNLRGQYFDVLGESMSILPFDDMAMLYAAKVCKSEIDSGHFKTRDISDRIAMKADIQILGSILAHKPDVVISHDPNFQALALRHGIKVQELPKPPPKQLEMKFGKK